jgi:hypothetical protein
VGCLGEVALAGLEVALADLCEFGADRPPGLAGACLGQPDEHEREEADQDVGADALVFAVEDGAKQERARCASRDARHLGGSPK